nr:hypothetical protein [Tanacetum cinerariifolium]
MLLTKMEKVLPKPNRLLIRVEAEKDGNLSSVDMEEGIGLTLPRANRLEILGSHYLSAVDFDSMSRYLIKGDFGAVYVDGRKALHSHVNKFGHKALKQYRESEDEGNATTYCSQM